MSNKLTGKLTLQGAIIYAWHTDEIDDKEALLASYSIWGDELSYILLGAAVRSPAAWYVAAPITAAYVTAELYEDPEPALEFIEEYQEVVQDISPQVGPKSSDDLLLEAYAWYNVYRKYKHVPKIWWHLI